MKVNINGIEIYYEVYGSGPPILFLHGNRESSRIFKNLPALLEKDYRLYLIDSRDHGNSGRSKQLNYQLMADDIEQFIIGLNIERPLLFGFSDGGIIGLLLAIRSPDLLSGLIAAGANIVPAGMKEKWLRMIQISYFFSRSPKDKMILTEPHIDPCELKKITIPTLILAGGKDMIEESHTKLIARNINHSILKILPQESHSSYVYENQKLYQAISGFMNDYYGPVG